MDKALLTIFDYLLAIHTTTVPHSVLSRREGVLVLCLVCDCVTISTQLALYPALGRYNNASVLL